jgi:rare lipoprotein A
MIGRSMKLLPVVATTVIGLAAMRAAPAMADSARPPSPRTEAARPGEPGWQQVGEASYYSNKYNGRRTANGQRYNPAALTAAHPYLPLGTRLQVLCEATGRSVVVTVNDRQTPNGRILDLSRRAAEDLGIVSSGRARVRLIALAPGEAAALSQAVYTTPADPAPAYAPIQAAATHPHPPRRTAFGTAVSHQRHASRAAVHAVRAAATDARLHRHAPRGAGMHAARVHVPPRPLS